jgi:hypothetical protein
MMARFPREQFVDPTHVTRRVLVAAEEVVYVRSILEASNGVAAVYSESGGDLTFVTSPCRVAELEQVLLDLKGELAESWLLGPVGV